MYPEVLGDLLDRHSGLPLPGNANHVITELARVGLRHSNILPGHLRQAISDVTYPCSSPLRLSAFERLFQATIRDQVEVVLLPSILHFTVLDSPRWIKPSFEATTGARIVTMS